MTLVFKASHRYARMAPRKAQPIMNMIRGLPAANALDRLRNDNHRASAFVHKVLASAVANALQNEAVRPNRLVVSEALVHEGPLLMGRLRFRPGPMGRAMPFRRRTCHLHIKVADPGVAGEAPEPEASEPVEETVTETEVAEADTEAPAAEDSDSEDSDAEESKPEGEEK